MKKGPYEILVRFHDQQITGAYYQEAVYDDDGTIIASLDLVSIEGIRSNSAALNAIKGLLPGLLESAEQENAKGKLEETKTQLEELQTELSISRERLRRIETREDRVEEKPVIKKDVAGVRRTNVLK